MKNTYRIGGALAIGIVVILGAFYMKDGLRADEANGVVVVANAPNRDYIESQDSDSDGIPNWQESLTGKAYTTITTPTSTISVSEDTVYTPPTTLTGKFSEAFFQDYMDGKIKGQDFSDPTAFVTNAVTAIEQNAQSKRHSRAEIQIIPDSKEAIRAYGNQIAEIIQKYPVPQVNEGTILQKALMANDPEILTALIPIRTAYVGMIADTLRMDVPESFALLHVDLLNVYEAILTDIEAMQVAFIDPLYTLARTKGYEADTVTLFTVLKNMNSELTKNGITYTNNEVGAFFYLFDIFFGFFFERIYAHRATKVIGLSFIYKSFFCFFVYLFAAYRANFISYIYCVTS